MTTPDDMCDRIVDVIRNMVKDINLIHAAHDVELSPPVQRLIDNLRAAADDYTGMKGTRQ